MATAVISTGSELLTGARQNTNLSFLTRALSAAGEPAALAITVGDTPAELAAALAAALKSADTVIVSGGLGAAADDVTLDVVSRFFGLELVEVPELRDRIVSVWSERHRGRCPKQQLRQARIPAGAELLPNPPGIVPGIAVTVDYAQKPRRLYLLPGNPEEFEAVVRTSLFPQTEPDIAEQVIRQLLRRQLSCGCAESCTGGLVADRFVSITGASQVFKGGVVSYANSVKMALLHVPEKVLAAVGAVSAECAESMALGCCGALDCDCAVSTTGIAGPGGGTPEKPVGLVFIGAAVRGVTATRELQLHGSRRQIREAAAEAALRLLFELLGREENLC